MARCSLPARETWKGYDVTVNRSPAPHSSATRRATSGVPSSERLSTITTCWTASSIGGSTQGRLCASFLSRNTQVSPGRSAPSFQGQRTS